MIVMEKFDSLIIGEVAQDTNVDFDGTVVQAVGGAVYYSGCAAANMGHKIAVLPKADLSQLDVTAAFHEKAPSMLVGMVATEEQVPRETTAGRAMCLNMMPTAPLPPPNHANRGKAVKI